MGKRILLAAAAAGALVGVLALVSAADTARGDAQVFTYTHLYSDAQGVSHFRDEQIRIETPSIVPGASEQRLAAHVLATGPGATLLYLPRGAREDWHRAPRRMYLIALVGTSEVTASDGEVRRFGPGTVVLMDDLTGKGHITRSVGNVDHVALTVPVRESGLMPADSH